MKNIWQKLRTQHPPFFVQAPMEDVSDSVFRQMLLHTEKPDLFFTEFTNVDGMFSKGKDAVIQRLTHTPQEKPIIAQIWGKNPGNYYKAAALINKLGFDGVDINMGCPQKEVVKKGLCAALIRNQKMAADIIDATKSGAGDLPVSVKTRIGFEKIITEEWVGFLLEQELDAIIIHGRTVKEMSEAPAHWDEIGRAVALRNKRKVPTLIVGNGDVKTRAEGSEKAHTYGVDGIMIGRGILEDPWVFSQKDSGSPIHSVDERLSLYLTHIQLHEKTWGSTKNFDRLKKYARMYIKGFDGASVIRSKCVASKNIHDLTAQLQQYLTLNKNK